MAVRRTPLGGAARIWFNDGMRTSRKSGGADVTRAGRLLSGVLALLLSTMLAACDSSEDPGAQQWLHGTWELNFNPDRDDQDDLTFREDGTVRIDTANERIVNGKYQVSGNDLLLVLVVNDKPVEVHFEVSQDKSRLVYGNGAYYVKKSAPPH